MLCLSIFDIRSTGQNIFQVIQVEIFIFHQLDFHSFYRLVRRSFQYDRNGTEYITSFNGIPVFDGFIIGPHSCIFRFHFHIDITRLIFRNIPHYLYPDLNCIHIGIDINK